MSSTHPDLHQRRGGDSFLMDAGSCLKNADTASDGVTARNKEDWRSKVGYSLLQIFQ